MLEIYSLDFFARRLIHRLRLRRRDRTALHSLYQLQTHHLMRTFTRMQTYSIVAACAGQYAPLLISLFGAGRGHFYPSTHIPIPNSSLKFSGRSFMKNIKAWNSHNADVQVVKSLISRAADTLASLRVDDGHVACLGELDISVLGTASSSHPSRPPNLHPIRRPVRLARRAWAAQSTTSRTGLIHR